MNAIPIVEQIRTYIDWMQTRGHINLSANPNPLWPTKIDQNPDLIEKKISNRALSLAFLTLQQLNPEEEAMIAKIAKALDYLPEEWRIIYPDSDSGVFAKEISSYQKRVVLGMETVNVLQDRVDTLIKNHIMIDCGKSLLLVIDHPKFMIENPSSKAAAWSALQKLRK